MGDHSRFQSRRRTDFLVAGAVALGLGWDAAVYPAGRRHWVIWKAERIDELLPVWTFHAHLAKREDLVREWRVRPCTCADPEECILLAVTEAVRALYPSQLSADVAILRLLKEQDKTLDGNTPS